METRKGTPASLGQMNYLRSLLRDRDIPEAQAAPVRDALNTGTLTVLEASMAIDLFKVQGYRPRAAAVRGVVSPEVETLTGLLAQFPSPGNFAIERGALMGTLPDLKFTNDFMFVALKQNPYTKVRKLVKMTGAVGRFSLWRIPVADQIELARLLLLPGAGLAAMQKFGEIYMVCGKCLAPLTDELSRKLNMGPVCRGRWGS